MQCWQSSFPLEWISTLLWPCFHTSWKVSAFSRERRMVWWATDNPHSNRLQRLLFPFMVHPPFPLVSFSARRILTTSFSLMQLLVIFFLHSDDGYDVTTTKRGPADGRENSSRVNESRKRVVVSKPAHLKYRACRVEEAH